ncbi:MAG: GPP34 family phosphoprotein [Acidiferrobacterales bacterium]|nr:GPP34 family phosphoprotein [Acidiferrobacterales bacterium]
MITISEEIFILMLDSETGRLTDRLPSETISNTLSGALLMELAINNRIDTDLEGLFVTSNASMREPLLDIVLEQIAADPKKRPTRYWVRVFATGAERIADRLTESLVERGILLRQRDRLLRFIGNYTITHESGRSDRDVLHRIAGIVQTNDIPAPRDIMIIALADACGLWELVFGPDTFTTVEPRIKSFAGIELIGQAVVQEIAKARTD